MLKCSLRLMGLSDVTCMFFISESTCFFSNILRTMANSSILDSVATFEKQALNASLDQGWLDALKAAHIDTLGKLSYAITKPGTPVTDEALRAFTRSVRGGHEPSLAVNAALKRLVFESQTFAVAALKASVSAPESETQKHLTAPDRIARATQLKARYPGLDISGPLGPSHMLYDQCLTIFDSEEVRYIPPSKCLSRQQELANQKPEKEVQLDAAKGSLVVKEVNHRKEVQPCSDLALYQALSRRALAFDLIGLATYTTVHKWHNRMFALMEQPPAPGFSRVKLRADRQAFVRMGEQVNGALKPRADGAKPLDAVIEVLANDVSVSYFLLPMPAVKEVDKVTKDPPKKPPKDPIKKVKTIKKKTRDPMPKGLHGMESRTKDNKPICFSYNLGRCNNEKCSREHVCCVPGCGKPHPQTEHH